MSFIRQPFLATLFAFNLFSERSLLTREKNENYVQTAERSTPFHWKYKGGTLSRRKSSSRL